MVDSTKNSLFGKVSSLFGAKDDVGEKIEIEEVLEVKAEGFFEGISNRFFGDKGEGEMINIEAFEVIAHDLEVVVVKKEVEADGFVNVTQEMVTLNKLNNDVGFMGVITSKTGEFWDGAKNMLSDSWSFTTSKASNAKTATIEFSQSTADSLVHFTKEIGTKYDSIELSPKFFSFIQVVDLVVVITALEELLMKQKRGSKEFVALTVVLGLLLLLNRSKDSMMKELGVPGANNELTQDMQLLFKSVTFKDMVETAEPILLIIPNGNYVLLILKLFV